VKTRLSFVTNSSSSSFVLAVKNEGFLKSGTSRLEKVAKKLIFGNADVIANADDLEEYILKDSYSGTLEEALEEPYYKEKFDKCLSYINKGYLIVDRTIDYSEDTLSELISNLPDGEDIIMIEREC
jgi:hypothetical protein